MPIFEKPPIETLAPARDRWTPIYLEHGRLEVDDSSIKWIGADGLVYRLPVATISALMLGPGTTVTHAAVKACARIAPDMRHVDNPNPARDPVPAPHWSVVLRALRIASGISQEGWAARLGYGRRTIQRWEHAELAPDAAATDALVRLCADYGLFREHRNGVLSGRTLSHC